ncbi:MAG TPA: cyclodeaminase/cyclohydrolase family protein [Acidobacteriaceae bacterium]|nr:cyclodeaminase/cyclohydrolase family protein [Acidobacteriaceae bacterium]
MLPETQLSLPAAHGFRQLRYTRCKNVFAHLPSRNLPHPDWPYPGQAFERCGIIEAMSSLHIRSFGEPPTSIWALDATQVRDRTASLSPTPGGGSISVFTATLGLALVHKGASISLKRSGEDATRRDALVELCETINSAIVLLSGLADDDSQAFRNYLEARSLPRTTDGEKALRNKTMEAAILEATRVPITSAREICAALEQAERAVNLSDPHLLTDIVGGAMLMKAAVDAVLLNVDANVSLLSDEGLRVALGQERVELGEISLARSEAIGLAYRARIAGLGDIPGNSA